MQEVLLVHARALADGTYGVNAQLAALPLSTGHAAPPDIAAIYTGDDDARMAYGEKGETWPALVVLDEDNGEWEGEIATKDRDGDVRVTTLYVPRDRDDALTYRNSSYTRRAIVKTLRDFLATASDPQRTENDIYVIIATALRRRARTEDIRGIPHAGGVTVTYRVRDRAP
jgi:hypothetical protein